MNNLVRIILSVFFILSGDLVFARGCLDNDPPVGYHCEGNRTVKDKNTVSPKVMGTLSPIDNIYLGYIKDTPDRPGRTIENTDEVRLRIGAQTKDIVLDSIYGKFNTQEEVESVSRYLSNSLTHDLNIEIVNETAHVSEDVQHNFVKCGHHGETIDEMVTSQYHNVDYVFKIQTTDGINFLFNGKVRYLISKE